MSLITSLTKRQPTTTSSGPVRDIREKDGRLAFWLVVPSLIVLTIVIAFPVVWSFVRSLYGDGIGATPFVGGDNYANALWGNGSAEFWDAARFTYFFTAVSVVLEVLIGVGMALVANRAFRGRGLLRASVLVPWAIPTAVAAVLWKWAFDPNGIVNAVTGWDLIWTGAEGPSTVAIIVADVWKTAPFVALLVLAGLQIIPEDVYEAARLDGATAWQQFVRITLPLVRPALLVAILFRLLDALRMYDLPAIMTGGANGTTTLSVLVVQSSLSQLKPGYGGALATLTFLLIFITAFLFVRMLNVNAVEQAGVRTPRKKDSE
ncbi:carbohydrate ABC transporter permease [Demequina muriae]|uniref:Sugar ABC transporter permease n=1 Tax=Demequina muriae TaxID=3051664 RepID=A0ABT8GE18_9MICO|nr:sugar ABC transporter permease [Demequina sp. EGI L300058]MDN4479675.1 sugar ABC transporter permease [Demequina sp. EGI L300058]